MSLKIHVIDRIEPLKDGTDVAAKCGEIIPKACGVFMWDFQAIGAPLDIPITKVCTKCRRVVQEHGFRPERNYVYGVVAENEKALLIQNEEITA